MISPQTRRLLSTMATWSRDESKFKRDCAAMATEVLEELERSSAVAAPASKEIAENFSHIFDARSAELRNVLIAIRDQAEAAIRPAPARRKS
jgi:hypothetical protein